MSYLLDTNICIDIIKRRPETVLRSLHEHLHEKLYISAITLAELEDGVAKSRFPERNNVALLGFLSILDVLPFSGKAAMSYGALRAELERRGTPIGAMDLLIASHALAHDFTLVTNDTKDFSRVPDLKVENWV